MSLFNFFQKKEYSIGIVPGKETQKMLDKRDDETIYLFLKYLGDSGRFKNSIELLVHKHRDAPFKVVTEGNLLSLDQKKELKLNSKKKYGDKYIQTLTEIGLADKASVDFLINSYYQAF